jgi:uncharacterized protein (DUF983 family)
MSAAFVAPRIARWYRSGRLKRGQRMEGTMTQEGRLSVLGRIRNVVTFTLNRCPKCGHPAMVSNDPTLISADPGAHCAQCGWASPTSPTSGLPGSLSFWMGVIAAVLVTLMAIFHVPEYPLLAVTVVYATSALAIVMGLLPAVLPYPLNTEEPFAIVTCIIEGLFILSEVSVTIYVILLALGVVVDTTPK